jgi:hypothetical protein
MRGLRSVAAAFAAVWFLALPAAASVLIEIDKSAQRMTVTQDGARLYTWPVSTGQRGYDTPSGDYKPFRMEKTHFSREWDDAPMPHSIFFTQRGHAIHGTEHTRSIGRPASHGCVRLEPQNASVLFNLVKKEGMANVRVVLSGVTPGGGGPAMVRRRAPNYDDDVTGSAPPRRVTREYGYQGNPWNSDFYDRRYREPTPPPPSFYGRSPYGWD